MPFLYTTFNCVTEALFFRSSMIYFTALESFVYFLLFIYNKLYLRFFLTSFLGANGLKLGSCFSLSSLLRLLLFFPPLLS